MTDSKRLALSRCGYVESPAGHGKTRLIANAVAENCAHELILTHTHAGVNALRKHLREVGVSPRCCQIDTIAGWALRFCNAYPQTSGIPLTQKPQEINWQEVYKGARAVLQTPVRAVVGTSYSGLYVDEYQDCTKDQHDLIMECS